MHANRHTRGQRWLAWVMAVVLCLGLLPGAALAAEETGTYQKVTENQEDWSGEYLLVYEAGDTNAYVFDGSLNKLDAVNNYVSAEIENETIKADQKYSVTVEAVTGGYVIKAASGSYIYASSDSNSLATTENQSTAARYPITFAVEEDEIDIELSSGPHMRFNAASDQMRFRYYKSVTYDKQKPVTLYRLEESSVPAPGTVAAPQATPQSGTVASGTEITLTCTTAGAEIYYTLDGSDPSDGENVNRKLYSEDNQPTITENCTLKAVAVLGGVSSAVQTLEYTVKTESTAPIANGDQVVIYAPAYNKALSSEKTGHYNVGTDITVEADGTVTGYVASDIWTVVANEDGTYSFQQGDQNIGLGDSYASMDLGAVHDDWKLIDLGNGLYNIQNTVRGNYMEWYTQYSNWSTYNSSSAATDDQFQLSFYKVTGETPDPEPSEAPFEANDTIVIYAPSNNMALSATVKNDYYPIGVEVAVEGETLIGYGATEVWTVGGEDGAWTFTSNSGKTLSMAGNYSSVYPGAGYNETWVLEAAETEGQYYVKNAGRGTYMFWDDEYDDWTTRADEKTAVSFRVVEPPEEEPDVSGLEVRATPASGASVEAGDTIELTAAAGAEIYYTTDGTDPTENSTHYESPITLGSGEGQVPAPTDDKSLVIKAISVATNEEGEEEIGDVCTFTYQAPVTLDGYQLYFGQLHSHTNISDGAGTVEEAFTHASNVDNLDFLAVTDHSNSFDNESDASVDLGADLLSSETSSEWVQGHKAAKDATKDDFVGIYGFEMTWSDGFGHINTFNTPGFESRSNSEFGNKSGSTEGYQNYYDKLVEVEDSLSQFNHPGTTFGDFQDFAFYDPQVDQPAMSTTPGPWTRAGTWPPPTTRTTTRATGATPTLPAPWSWPRTSPRRVSTTPSATTGCMPPRTTTCPSSTTSTATPWDPS